jgi:hypothetical protein
MASGSICGPSLYVAGWAVNRDIVALAGKSGNAAINNTRHRRMLRLWRAGNFSGLSENLFRHCFRPDFNQAVRIKADLFDLANGTNGRIHIGDGHGFDCHITAPAMKDDADSLTVRHYRHHSPVVELVFRQIPCLGIPVGNSRHFNISGLLVSVIG